MQDNRAKLPHVGGKRFETLSKHSGFDPIYGGPSQRGNSVGDATRETWPHVI